MKPSMLPGICADAVVAAAAAKVQIRYGLDGMGRIRHISEVLSGLVSGCVCPACGTPLVAYKGKSKRHHFGHHADRACSGAMETALHEFAKQVLMDSRSLMLPPLLARCGEVTEPIANARAFAYEGVASEVTMPNMRPDIVVWRGETKLLVEVAVSHSCEDIKLERLRERRLASMEIDLSKVRHDASPQEHADAVLRSAPRHWLFNRHIDDTEVKLRAQALERAATEKAKQDKEWGKQAADLAAAYKLDDFAAPESWLTSTRDAALMAIVGVAVPGDACFATPATGWQSAILDHFVLGHRHHSDFTLSLVIEWLAEKRFLKSAFRALPADDDAPIIKHLRLTVTEFRPPVEVVNEFLTWLARHGIIDKRRFSWSARTVKAHEARQQHAHAIVVRNRMAELATASRQSRN